MEKKKSLVHVDESGHASMVDVGTKSETHRIAIACGEISMSLETLKLIENNELAKGDALQIARIAAIQASKETARLIPLCHPLPLTRVSVKFELDFTHQVVRATSRVETLARTGVEMEALTATSVALLTIYDMVKSVERAAEIRNIHLKFKSGGKSGTYEKTNSPD